MRRNYVRASVKVLIYLILCFLFFWLISDAITSRINYAYDRGYREGLAAQDIKVRDQQCLQWMFNSNMVEVKKRICQK